jgi:Flp pilus assembly protein CpaB
MKSLNPALHLIAIACGLAGAFLLGRASVTTELPSQQEAAVSAPTVEPANGQPSAKAIEIAKAIEEYALELRVPKPQPPQVVTAYPATIEAIVAKKTLPMGTLLEENDLENLLGTIKFPKDCLPPDVIVNAEELKNRRLNRTMRQGNYFTAEDVGRDDGIKIPEGMYMYALKTDPGTVGFFAPGARIDLISIESLPDGKAKSAVILQNLLVLVIESEIRRERATISFAVTSEQALTLSAAEKRGDIKCILRAPQDAK